MKRTFIYLVEPLPYVLLNKEAKEIALENVRNKMGDEIPDLMFVEDKILESMANDYMFHKNGKIFKKREECFE